MQILTGSCENMECRRNLIKKKLCFTYEKKDRARFTSHHDMMRLFERALRRAGLPVRMTEGHNPRPRMVFPHPLALGIESECEQIEVEFCQEIDPASALVALRTATLPVVSVVGVTVLSPVKKGRTVESCRYHLLGWNAGRDALQKAIAAFKEHILATPEADLKSNRLTGVTAVQERDGHVVCSLSHTGKKTARPEAIVAFLAEVLREDATAICIRKIEMSMNQSGS